MKSNSHLNGDTSEVRADHDDRVVAGIMMLLGSDGLNSNSSNNSASQSLNTQLGERTAADDSNARLPKHASIPETAPPARQTSSIASSNSNGGSVTFALPATCAVATSNEVPPIRGYGSAASCESLSSSGEEQRKRPALRNAKVSNNANRISGGNTSSNNGSNASGSGSDGGGNNTSSNASSNPVVTAGSSGTATNSNNSSGSGSDGGSGSGNRQSGGEASNDYYYAGYGSGSLATNGSLHAHGGESSTGAYHHYRHQEARRPDIPTLASFRGSSLAAASAELNQNHSVGGNLPHALPPAMSARRVLVTADDAMDPPNITSSTSHLRHHSRHAHHHRTPTALAPAAQATSSLSSGIPSTIGPSTNHDDIRLPPHDQSQQHVTVMANRHFPPPPAGNDSSRSSLSSYPNSSSCNSLDDLDTNGAVKAKSSRDGATDQGPRPMEIEPTVRNHRKRSHYDADHQATDIVLSTPDATMTNGLALMEKALQQKVRSSHHYHSRSTGRKMLEESFLSAKRNLSSSSSPDDAKAITASALDSNTSSVSASASTTMPKGKLVYNMSNSNRPIKDVSFQDTLIYSLGPDVMALVVSFLPVTESHTLLTSPLSKTWLETYTVPQELWKILCTSKPFYAKLEENPEGSSNASACSFPLCNDLEVRHLFGRYRLLYSSFVRCVKYLDRLKDDAINGRTPSVYSESQQDPYPTTQNGSLKAYFARARRLVKRTRRNARSPSSSSVSDSLTPDSGEEQKQSENKPQAEAAASSSGSENSSSSRQDLQPRFGRSMLTERLLRPTRTGDVDNVNLPWSCAIYSVVNWMVAFVDVEGIQIMCLKVLPYLLEDETQRTTAQRAGLTDSVLRAMVIFPDSIELHTAAFHTLVLLARPLGGNEGMLFHTAMVNIRGIFDSGNNRSNNSKNGIVIMLDSMRRFAHDEMLQAMSCWSLVNVALTPLQKSMLVRLGGLTVTANAMLQHPYNAEVQFRALFALINLVIPSEVQTEQTEEQRDFEREVFQQLGEVGETSEREMLDASVGQISNLVVVAMKNFCSSEAILNRACLVLHNLSLHEAYHSILLWTPNCYQMLEWCIGNYPHDHVLQQSAGGTISRLNATLSSDDELRARFTNSIRAQQQHSLQLARREAAYLQEQAEHENTDQVSSL